MKQKLQEEYCNKNKVPFFAYMTYCFNCRNKYWDKISEEKAKNEHITGCPNCNRSFL